MKREDIDSLIRDAELIARYAAYNGRLPADCHIFEEMKMAVAAANQEKEFTLSPLLAEINRLVKETNTTVEEVRHRSTVVGKIKRIFVSFTPYVIGGMTLIIMLYLAFQSSQLFKADMALREYAAFESQQLQDKINRAWRMYRFENVLKIKGPPLDQLDGYQKLVDESRRLVNKRWAIQELLHEASIIRYVPDVFEYGPANLKPAEKMYKAEDNTERDRFQEGKELPEIAIECSTNSITMTSLEGLKSGGNSKNSNYSYVDEIYCYLQSIRILADQYEYPLQMFIYETRIKVNVLTAWLLPALYGLLGACVFIMRGFLRTEVNQILILELRVIDALSLVFRIGLGGFAGIIIGWFFIPTLPATTLAPTASSSENIAVAISSLPFGIAFLAGFSIETVFALLDRMIRAAVRQDVMHKVGKGTTRR